MMFYSRLNFARAAAAGVLLLTLIGAGYGASSDKDLRIRFALSDTLFQDLNENDARAAVKAWSDSLTSSTHIELEGSLQLLGSEALQRAIANHTVDGFSISMPEYVKVAPFIDPVIIADDYSVKPGLDYVLVVRRDGAILDLAGLRGRTLLVCQGPSLILALPWLETLLGAAKLEPADRFFSRVKKPLRAAQTVLPVFFGTADAALVTRRAFETICELNPQLRQKLQILAFSPRLFTGFFCIHKDCSDAIKSRIKQALTGYYDTPNGRQILTLFQAGRLVAADSSLLRESVDLMANYERLKARRQGGIR